MKKRWIVWSILSACILLNISVDHFTKKIAKEKLQGRPPISFCNNTIILTYTENDGAFLSIFSKTGRTAKTIILILIPLVALTAGTFYIFYNRKAPLPEKILIATIIGGGISNTADRILYGQVADFLNFGIGALRTGILNVADISITFGAGILVLYLLKQKRNDGT